MAAVASPADFEGPAPRRTNDRVIGICPGCEDVLEVDPRRAVCPKCDVALLIEHEIRRRRA